MKFIITGTVIEITNAASNKIHEVRNMGENNPIQESSTACTYSIYVVYMR